MKRLSCLLLVLQSIISAHAQDTTRKGNNSLLKAYEQGKKDYPAMGGLAIFAKDIIKDEALAKTIAIDYKENYLDKLTENELCTGKNLDFIGEFYNLIDTGDKFFDLCYHQPKKVDEIMNYKGWAQFQVEQTITREEINAKLWAPDGTGLVKDPKWKSINEVLSHKYGWDYTQRAIIDGQIAWYEYKKDTLSIIKYRVRKIDKYGLDTVGFGKADENNFIYYMLFMHCKNNETLNKAIRWMQIILKTEPHDGAYLDTYANLLYKVGRTVEALKFEKRAMDLDPTNKELASNFYDMQRNTPTWPIN